MGSRNLTSEAICEAMMQKYDWYLGLFDLADWPFRGYFMCSFSRLRRANPSKTYLTQPVLLDPPLVEKGGLKIRLPKRLDPWAFSSP